jgi:glycosyltransferase involved in cell wall biosynthesis
MVVTEDRNAGVPRSLKRPVRLAAAREPRGPLVSVLLSTRNGERYLAQALDSIAAQTWPYVELIAVDDGSTDGTRKILGKYARAHSNVQVIRTAGIGLAGALAHAASLAHGQLLARHDDDDESHPERFETQLRYLDEHRRIGVVGSRVDILNEHGLRIGAYPVPVDEQAIRRVARRDRPFLHGAVMMRRSLYEQAGGYRAAFQSAEDLDLWLRIPAETFANVPETLYRWRIHPDGEFAARRTSKLHYVALARTFAEERRRTGTDSYELLVREADPEGLLRWYPRADRLELQLGQAYLQNGHGRRARRHFANALTHPRSALPAAAGWIRCWLSATKPKARGRSRGGFWMKQRPLR